MVYYFWIISWLMTFLMMESVEEEACDVICIMKRLFFIITTFSFTVDGFVNFLVNSMKINFWSTYIICWEVWYLWISNWWDRCMRSCRKILIPSLSLEGYLTKSSILWKMQVFCGEMIDPWIWRLHTCLHYIL